MTDTPGAHGLFAATGKKSKPVYVRDGDGNKKKALYLPRNGDDFYPTPSEPTRSFCKAEMSRLLQFEQIFECAAGDGKMASDLEECTGLNILKSDLIDRGCGANICDFYDLTTLPANTCIITNPPFSECHGDPKWVRHALEVLKAPYLALLFRCNGWAQLRSSPYGENTSHHGYTSCAGGLISPGKVRHQCSTHGMSGMINMTAMNVFSG